jgi:hypothetical protein
MCLYIHIYLNVQTPPGIAALLAHIYIYIYTEINETIYIYIPTYGYILTHTYIHTYIYINIYEYILIYIPRCAAPPGMATLLVLAFLEDRARFPACGPLSSRIELNKGGAGTPSLTGCNCRPFSTALPLYPIPRPDAGP